MEQGITANDVAAIPHGEAFSRAVEFSGQSADSLTQYFYQLHNVGMAWYIISAIGMISAVGIYIYGKWLLRLKEQNAI